MLYCPSYTTKVIKSDQVIYFEEDNGISQRLREIVFKEHTFFIPVLIASSLISSPIVDQHPVATTDDEPIENVDPVALYIDPIALDVAMDIPLRSQRGRRPTILDDYFVYL